MIRLVYVSSAAFALWFAGCAKGPAEFGQFLISWEVSGEGNPIACDDPAVDPAAIEIRVVSDEDEDVRTVPCEQASAATKTLPLADYTVTLSVLDSAGVVVADESVPQELSEPESLVEVDVPIPVVEGRFDVTWAVVMGTENQCPSGSSIEIVSQNLNDAIPSVVTRYNCSRFNGLTDLLPFGDYAVNVRLLGGAGGVIAESSAAGTLSFGSRIVPVAISLSL